MEDYDLISVENSIESALYDLAHSTQASERSKERWRKTIKWGLNWLEEFHPAHHLVSELKSFQ